MAGGHSQAVGGHRGCHLCPATSRRCGACFSCDVNEEKGERDGLPAFMWTVMMTCVVTVLTMWHVC